MDPIKLSEITVDKIKTGELKETIPEFYELEGIIENNSGHINDPVINHIFSVLSELEKLLESASKEVKDYFDQKIDSHLRKELLRFVTIFHDIGKKETIKKDGDIVTFPGHEKMGAEKLRKILPRFNLSENEKEMILQIIENHGFFHGALDRPEDNPDKEVDQFRQEFPDTFLEVVLLTKADIFGGQLKERNLEKFNFKIAFLDKIINSY